MVKPNRFDGMMHEFCVGNGYCGSSRDGVFSHVSDFIPETGEVTALDFVNWLLIAEGMDPAYVELEIKSHLLSIFQKHMSSDVVEASNLISGCHGA